MSDHDGTGDPTIGSDRADGMTASFDRESGQATGLSLAAKVVASIGLVGLLVLLAPFAFMVALVMATTWQVAAIGTGAAALAIAHRAVGRPPADVFAIAGVATVVGWACALVLSGWDIEGKLDDGQKSLQEAVVAYLGVGGGMLALVFGLVAALRARGFAGRYAGVLMAVAGAVCVGGIAFL